MIYSNKLYRKKKIIFNLYIEGFVIYNIYQSIVFICNIEY